VWSWITNSNILEKLQKKDIGLELLAKVLLPFVCTGTITALLHKVLKNGYKYVSTSLIINPGMSLTPTDLYGLRHLVALGISKSEIGAKGKILEDSEWVGKTTGQGLLYTD
jgi:hypothetical protein